LRYAGGRREKNKGGRLKDIIKSKGTTDSKDVLEDGVPGVTFWRQLRGLGILMGGGKF